MTKLQSTTRCVSLDLAGNHFYFIVILYICISLSSLLFFSSPVGMCDVCTYNLSDWFESILIIYIQCGHAVDWFFSRSLVRFGSVLVIRWFYFIHSFVLLNTLIPSPERVPIRHHSLCLPHSLFLLSFHYLYTVIYWIDWAKIRRHSNYIIT